MRPQAVSYLSYTTFEAPIAARRSRSRDAAPPVGTRERPTESAIDDTGALFAADRNDRRLWALHAGFLALEVSPTAPTTVLAEAWRGGSRRASPARFLAVCTTEPLTDVQAKAAGTPAARRTR